MDRRPKSPVLMLALLLFVGAVLTTGCGGSSTAPTTTQAAPQGSPQQPSDSAAAPQDSAAPPDRAATTESPSTAPVEPSRPAQQPARPAPTQPRPHATANGATHDANGAAAVAGSAAPPAPVIRTIPAGTAMDLIVQEAVSSQTSQVGETVRAQVAHDIVVDGAVAVPAGSMLEGSVSEAVPQKKIGGTSKLAITFQTLRFPSGDASPMAATFSMEGKSQTGKDAATIGGSAAGGAILGKVLGGKSKHAAIGAVVGAAAGTAVAAKNKGDEVDLPAGTVLTVTLSIPAEVTVR